MKPKIFNIRLITLLFLLTVAGCKKDEPLETDPATIILGKWVIIEMGNTPNMEPVENAINYKEYLPDSVLREYDYETEKFYYKKYWIDTLLHESISYSEGNLIFEYKYQFTEKNNKLHLEYANMLALFNDFVFERIK